MLIDDVKITVYAGKGGAGEVAWSRIKLQKGPMGGDGGKGGSVYAVGVSNLGALNQFRYIKDIKAENGKAGEGYLRRGQTGSDKFINVPVGTVIHFLDKDQKIEITKIGEKELLAKGGNGGWGNYRFQSSTNRSPKNVNPGLPGETVKLRLELKMMADIGLIGLPNAGKSSLINEITNAQSRVANYPFTTLEPHLGVFQDLVIADIPGIIEGAASGKGLGIKFLRHVERTKTLFHLISAESSTPIKDYKAIRKELGKYNKALLEKDEYIFLTKNDATNPKDVAKKLAKLKKINPGAIAISIYDYDSIQNVSRILEKLNSEKQA